MSAQGINPRQIPEQLETQRLLLNRLRYEDAEEIFYTYASKPECTRFVTWSTHQSVKDTREYLGRTISAWAQGIDFSYGIRLNINGRLIGSCGFLNEAGKIQIGYILGSLHWNNGYATEATCKLIDMLKSQNGVFRIGSFVDSENLASAKVLLKAGMQAEAVLSQWCRFPNQGNEPKDCILFKLL
jgi:[ribosomal protein S5]-alanine N-acetyltransferase